MRRNESALRQLGQIRLSSRPACFSFRAGFFAAAVSWAFAATGAQVLESDGRTELPGYLVGKLKQLKAAKPERGGRPVVYAWVNEAGFCAEVEWGNWGVVEEERFGLAEKHEPGCGIACVCGASEERIVADTRPAGPIVGAVTQEQFEKAERVGVVRCPRRKAKLVVAGLLTLYPSLLFELGNGNV